MNYRANWYEVWVCGDALDLDYLETSDLLRERDRISVGAALTEFFALLRVVDAFERGFQRGLFVAEMESFETK